MSFWFLQFSQKTNETNSTLLLWYLKSNCFCFVGELKTQKGHFEIKRTLVDMLHISYDWQLDLNIGAALEKTGVYYLLTDTP